MSAPTVETRAAVYFRDGDRCVSCGSHRDLTFQHRRAVGAGGSKIPPAPVDGACSCAFCNNEYEHRLQTLALAYGWKVQRWVSDPALVPMYYPVELRWFRLAGVERHPIAAVVALDMMHAVYGDKYLRWHEKANS